jgi:molybdopterin molybdotransferase
MIAVDEAKSRILARVNILESASLDVGKCCGRVLASDVAALRDQPPANASAMDGYAVRGDDVAPTPVRLRLIGEAPAGSMFDGTLNAGEAVRVFTGSVMPDGSDTVIMQENTERPDDNHVTITVETKPGRHVRLMGHDFKRGDTLIKTGTRLSPRHVGLAAAANNAALDIRRKPRIGVLSTGDELVAPGQAERPDQIVNSNTPMLASLIKRAGGKPVVIPFVGDTRAQLEAAIKALPEMDMLITIGGASVGRYDLVQDSLSANGFELDFWKIAMRPGKPVFFGTLDKMPVLGLPGNPVSSIVGAYLFLLSAIDKFLGANAETVRTIAAVLDGAISENGGRQAYLRAKAHQNVDGCMVASPISDQDSAALNSLSNADGFICRPPNAKAAVSGDRVPLLFFGEFGLI